MSMGVQAWVQFSAIPYCDGQVTKVIVMQAAFESPLFSPPPWLAKPEFSNTLQPMKYPSDDTNASLPKK